MRPRSEQVLVVGTGALKFIILSSSKCCIEYAFLAWILTDFLLRATTAALCI